MNASSCCIHWPLGLDFIQFNRLEDVSCTIMYDSKLSFRVIDIAIVKWRLGGKYALKSFNHTDMTNEMDVRTKTPLAEPLVMHSILTLQWTDSSCETRG